MQMRGTIIERFQSPLAVHGGLVSSSKTDTYKSLLTVCIFAVTLDETSKFSSKWIWI